VARRYVEHRHVHRHPVPWREHERLEHHRLHR
jgi:hypothetical protein